MTKKMRRMERVEWRRGEWPLGGGLYLNIHAGVHRVPTYDTADEAGISTKPGLRSQCAPCSIMKKQSYVLFLSNSGRFSTCQVTVLHSVTLNNVENVTRNNSWP